MLKRWLRILVPGGILIALVVLARRTGSLRAEIADVTPSSDPWTPIRLPDPPIPPWVASAEDGTCPPSHPIKAKATSGIYHLPGMLAYDRTKADRCYADESAASADGFTRAKR